MLIGELATRTSATARAIRLYESMGLIRVGRRGSYRVYNDQHANTVRLIRQAQAVGIQLVELKALQDSRGDLDWEALYQMLGDKLAANAIEQQRLRAQQQQLQSYRALLENCQQSSLATCSVATCSVTGADKA